MSNFYEYGRKRMLKKLKIISLVAIVFIIYQAACKMDDVDIPEPTGVSGAKVFLTISAVPDILPTNGVSRSNISVRLADYTNKPISNVTIYFETLNASSQRWDVGKFTSNYVPTGGDGMAYTTWISPSSAIATDIFVKAATVDGEYPYQISATTFISLVKPENYPDTPPTGACGTEGYPNLTFDFQPSNPKPNDTVWFSAAGSYDSDGYIVSYLWNFGDGTKGKGETTKHVYKAQGSYLVILTATDNDGKTCSITKSINVGEIFGCEISTTSGGPNGVSTITISSQNGVPNYRWHIDLGDGTVYDFLTSADSYTIDHIYSTPGPFNVYVTIKDGTGKVARCTGIVL